MKINNMKTNNVALHALCIIAGAIGKSADITIKGNRIVARWDMGRESSESAIIKIYDQADKHLPVLIRSDYDEEKALMTFTVEGFWEHEIPHNASTMRKVILHAVTGDIPKDKNLFRVTPPASDEDWLNLDDFEDGIGIHGTYGDHEIDFTVEHGYHRIGCFTSEGVWHACGHVNGYTIDLIAGSEAHAFTKMVRAIYRRSEKEYPDLACALKKNTVKWRTYGYCY